WLTKGNANAWHWWTINETGNAASNEGLYGTDRTTPAKRLWAIGQWSRFVRPGWIRLDATANPQSGIYVTAFKSPSGGNFAIVAVNIKTNRTSQTFNLSGFPTISSGTVTPYLTSSASNLAVQSSLAVTSTLTCTLPAQSVVTFYGATGGAAANAYPIQFDSTLGGRMWLPTSSSFLSA